jgi:hypothetical protein
MGRPIKKKYYNPRTYGATGGDGGQSGTASIGGESIAADVSGNITLNSITRGTGYYSANVVATIAAPLLAGGTTATVSTVHLFANGAIKALTLGNAGAGYTTANPAITFTGANSGAASATATLTSGTTAAAIRANVFFTGASYGDWNADMVKQRGSRTWICRNASYSETVKLVTSPNLNPYSAGTMTVIATFSDGSQFNISKITDRKVYSSTGESYKWTFDSVSGTGNVSATDITVQVQSS